jgi:hypothetical protein
MGELPKHPPVPTSVLLGYLIGVYAVLGEFLLLVIHIFDWGKIPALAHGILIGVVCVLSVVAWYRKDDFLKLRSTGGSIELTGTQIFVVCVFLMGLIGVGVALMALITGF